METIRPRVLVIDDDPANADTLAMVLNFSGFEATAVYSAQHGLDLAREIAYDHLITDVVMQGMNGIEAAIAIKQVLPNCCVLLLSGNNNTAELLEIAGARGHSFQIFAKPVHPVVLLEQLRGGPSVAANPHTFETN